MSDKASIEVVRTDEYVSVGRSHWRGRIVLVGGERFAEGRSGALYRECWKCRDFSGFLPEYAGVFAGECFGCRGTGYSTKVESEAMAVSLARRRITDRARAKRKRQEKEAAKHTERDAWAAANPEVAAALAEVMADYPVAPDGLPDYSLVSDWESRWGGFMTSLAQQAQYKALSEKQTAAVLPAIAEAKAARAEAAEVASKQRYLDVAKDAKVTVAGTVTVAATVEHGSFNGYGTTMSRLVIVEASGENEGVTVKMFGTGKSLWETERGDTVEVSGTVKDFAEYEGVPQTVLTRAKVKVLASVE